MTTRKNNLSVQYMTRIAILGALSAILFMIEIPVVAFYKLDISTLPALLGAFSMGPMAGLAILLIKDIFGMLHSSSMYVGELADFIMGAAFILPAALIYRRAKSRQNALIGMVAGTVCMIVVSGMASKALPFVDTELKLLLFVTAPFNLLKGIVLSALTFLLYKRLSPLLHVKK